MMQQIQRVAKRPDAISTWVMVSLVEGFILALLTPGLILQAGAVGLAALAGVAIFFLLAILLARGSTLGLNALVLINLLGTLALAGAVVAFLVAIPPLSALIMVVLIYMALGAISQGQRGWGIVMIIVWVIAFVVLFVSMPPERRARSNVMLGMLGLYLLMGGAVRFLFGVSFADLNRSNVLRYFGLNQPTVFGRGMVAGQQAINQVLRSSFGRLGLLVGSVTGPLRARRRAAAAAAAARPTERHQSRNALLAVVLLLLLPFAIRAFEQTTSLSLLITMNVGLLFVVLALGLNIVVGFAGLLDLGYAAFFAIGAYTVGVFTWPNLGLEWSFWIVIWLSSLVAAIFGVLIGTPTLRLRGDYLAIVTLAFGEIVPRAIRELWDIKIKIPFTDIYLVGSKLEGFNLTNGPQGMNPVGRPVLFGHEVGVDPLHLFGITVSPPMQWYFLIVVIGAIVLFAAYRLEHSRLGRAWMAIREDETAADAMGVDPIRTKLLAFALGASFSGFAGSIYAAMIQAIFPELFSFLVSIFLLILVIVSGMGNIWGVLVGGLMISVFDRVVLAQVVPQFVPGGDVLQRWRWVMYASGLIAVMVLRPEGLFPSAARRAELHAAEEEVPVELALTEEQLLSAEHVGEALAVAVATDPEEATS